jgi:ferredoxin
VTNPPRNTGPTHGHRGTNGHRPVGGYPGATAAYAGPTEQQGVVDYRDVTDHHGVVDYRDVTGRAPVTEQQGIADHRGVVDHRGPGAGSGRAEIVSNGHRYRQDARRPGSSGDPATTTWIPDPILDLDDEPRFRGTPPPLRDPTRARPEVSARSGWSAIGMEATPPVAPPAPVRRGPRLRVDWPNCRAHGLCHELLPEAVRLDEWGYPIVSPKALSPEVLDDARRAVTACPTLALRLVD